MTSDKILLPKVTGGIGCHGTSSYDRELDRGREGAASPAAVFSGIEMDGSVLSSW